MTYAFRLNQIEEDEDAFKCQPANVNDLDIQVRYNSFTEVVCTHVVFPPQAKHMCGEYKKTNNTTKICSLIKRNGVDVSMRNVC